MLFSQPTCMCIAAPLLSSHRDHAITTGYYSTIILRDSTVGTRIRIIRLPAFLFHFPIQLGSNNCFSGYSTILLQLVFTKNSSDAAPIPFAKISFNAAPFPFWFRSQRSNSPQSLMNMSQTAGYLNIPGAGTEVQLQGIMNVTGKSLTFGLFAPTWVYRQHPLRR